MQGCAVYQGLKYVSRDLGWCRPNSKYHKPHYFQLGEQVDHVCMVVARTGQNPWIENPRHKNWLILIDQVRIRCEDNNVAFMHVQPHFYRVWQVEPCHRLG